MTVQVAAETPPRDDITDYLARGLERADDTVEAILGARSREFAQRIPSFLRGAILQSIAAYAPPAAYTHTGGPALMLVPGLFCTPSVFNRLGLELERYGVDVYLPRPFPLGHGVLANIAPVHHSAAILLEDLQRLKTEEGIEEITLVGHSIGGIISLAAIATAEDGAYDLPLIRGVVALAAPLEGAPMARLFQFLPACRDIVPGSAVLVDIEKALPFVQRILATGFDSMVPEHSQNTQDTDRIVLSDWQHMDFFVGPEDRVRLTAQLIANLLPGTRIPEPSEKSMTSRRQQMGDGLKAVARLFGPRLDPDALSKPDPALVEVAKPTLRALKAYFRAEVCGLENMPEGKALVVGNHNGGITFFEPFFLGLEWYLSSGELLHYLGHDAMVAMPLVGNMLIKLGVIRASHDAANKAFEAGRKVVVFPGGNYEAFRPYAERHVIDFGPKTGYIKLALRNHVPIVPVLGIGGHETFFVLKRGARLARFTGVKRYLRSESFPIFLGLPWGVGFGPIFHLPLPAKTVVEVGEPISLDEYGPEVLEDKDALQAISRMVQDRLQEMMDRRALERQWPILG
jgi:1-acyl-sn-glycerol-3-phosphate acyltransferase